MLSFSTLIQAIGVTPPSSSLFSQNCQGPIPRQAFSLASLDEEKAVISAIPDFLLISKEKPTGSLSFHGFLLVVMVQSKFNIEGYWEA